MQNGTIDHIEAGAGGVTKGHAVKLSGGAFILCDDAADSVIGIALETKDQGQLVSVQTSGPVDARIGAALTLGGPLVCDGSGRLIDDSGTATEVVVGAALEVGVAASGSDYALAKVDLFPNKLANA